MTEKEYFELKEGDLIIYRWNDGMFSDYEGIMGLEVVSEIRSGDFRTVTPKFRILFNASTRFYSYDVACLAANDRMTKVTFEELILARLSGKYRVWFEEK